ncbi:hypothetical protein GIB67_027023 [Kingdonia uniflora]|uniref:Cation/H+ exchanger domain-containing protein n=1 Tax=Kingdonia uniflora TaxID=39325 RepID=A0A7J7P2C5_9MAGN|nr:hypothetical protein GIB67_027023 [Kingdonia uniflora]
MASHDIALDNYTDPAYARGESDDNLMSCVTLDYQNMGSLGDNPLTHFITLFLIELIIVAVVTRVLVYLFKYLRQPRIVAEIIGGVILGPTVLGRNFSYLIQIFPMKSLNVLTPMANIGVIYYMFLVGVEINPSAIKRIGKRSIIIGLTSVIVPFLVTGIATISLKDITMTRPVEETYKRYNPILQILFLGVTSAVTSFSGVARILTELKLINTDHGRTALSSALLANLCSWILLFIALVLAHDDDNWNDVKFWKVIPVGVLFVIVCFFCFRPGIIYLLENYTKGENISRSFIIFILMGTLFCAYMMAIVGIHPIFAAFVFGLIIPSGPLQVAITETLEDFVSGLLIPLYFLINGLRTNTTLISTAHKNWKYVIGVNVGVFATKLGTIVLAAMFQSMKARDGAIIGLLLSTQGLLGIVVLNLARDERLFDAETFTVLVFTMIVTTAIIVPLVTRISRSTKSFSTYKNRTLQRLLKTNADLRVLVCIHSPRDVQPIINLLETSHPTKALPLSVYALHLVELTGRASAMLVIHNTDKGNRVALNRTQAQSEHIVNAFLKYEQNAQFTYIQTLTAVSSYSTAHDDICNLAEDKRATLIIIPFHKEHTLDGMMEVTNPAFQSINQNVLANAPCSVGILIDRGLSMVSEDNVFSHDIAMLYIGGPDDREALSYARRMAAHPKVSLTIYRFLPAEQAVISTANDEQTVPLKVKINNDKEKEMEMDEEFITKFRQKYVINDSIVYTEMMVNNANELLQTISSIGDDIHDLYIVGRGNNYSESELTAGLREWSECPELGIIGDLLASADFGGKMSVLVVQQYISAGITKEFGTPDSHLSDPTLYFNRLSPGSIP